MPIRWFVGSNQRDPGLDFLRACAVLLVMARHFLDFNPKYEPAMHGLVATAALYGWAGVDLFFVLSGYLIFGSIFREEDRGTFKWTRFYVGRALRIWPAYYVSLLACWCLAIFPVKPGEYVPFLFFIQNYFGTNASLNNGIYWSLAVEEHFYLLAPALLLLTASFNRWRLNILIGLVFAPPWVRAFSYLFAGDDVRSFYDWIYYPTHGRFDSIAVGVLCAYLLRYRQDVVDVLKPWLPFISASLLLMAVVSTESMTRYHNVQTAASAVLGFSLMALFCGSLVMLSQTHRLFDRVGRGPFRLIAYLSFSMYLYHMIALRISGKLVWNGAADIPWLLIHAGLFVVLTMSIGALSYFGVERYFLKLKQSMLEPRRDGTWAAGCPIRFKPAAPKRREAAKSSARTARQNAA